VKRSVLVASIWLGAVASRAFAAEVSINGDARQTLDASNNYFLTNSPTGYAGKPMSAFDLTFLAATPTARYRLDTNYSYYTYWGPGAEQQLLKYGTPAGAKFSTEFFGARDKFNFVASWQRADVATTALEQTGVAVGRGTIDTYKVGGGVTHTISRTDSISWSSNVSTVSYSDPTQTPYIDFATNTAWSHRLDATTNLVNSVSLDWFSEDNVFKNQRLLWNATSALQSQLTRRLSLNASISAIFVNAYEKGAVQSVNPLGAFQVQAGTASGLLGNAALTYKFSPTTVASLTATHTVVPTIFGQLQETDSAGLVISHTVNQYSGITALTQFSKSSANGTSSEFFTASVNYEYKLAREWRTNLTYTYRQRDDTTGVATSSTVLLGLRRDFNLYGKPPGAPANAIPAAQLANDALVRGGLVLPTLNPEQPLNLRPGAEPPPTTPEEEGQPTANPDEAAPQD